MDIEMQGGRSAGGELLVQGSKNAVLPMIAAAILCEEPVAILHCPKIQDVFSMITILEEIGVDVTWDNDTLRIHASQIQTCQVRERKAGEIRASVLFLGAMLGRCKEAKICFPGGCSIGARPINYHIAALQQLGVDTTEEEDQICCCIGKEEGTDVKLPYPSVGATENIILYTVLGKRKIVIRNVAKEPEIQELCGFLRSMGARIWGDGTSTITIQGVPRLRGTDYALVADRIVFLTYGATVLASGGSAWLQTRGNEFPFECSYLQRAGARIQHTDKGIWIGGKQGIRNIPFVTTGPYPEFPTDAQSLFLALMTKARGDSMVEERVFENRFLVVKQLRKMGADIEVVGQRAYVRGVTRLHGECVDVTDLRSGASLLVAASMADGKTKIQHCHYLMRGYEKPVECLQQLGLQAEYTETK